MFEIKINICYNNKVTKNTAICRRFYSMEFITEEEKNDLEKDGYKLVYKDNVLTIRNYAGKLLVEIILLEDEGKNNFIINTEKDCYWATEIKSIVDAYGEVLWIFFKTTQSDDEQLVIEN